MSASWPVSPRQGPRIEYSIHRHDLQSRIPDETSIIRFGDRLRVKSVEKGETRLCIVEGDGVAPVPAGPQQIVTRMDDDEGQAAVGQEGHGLVLDKPIGFPVENAHR